MDHKSPDERLSALQTWVVRVREVEPLDSSLPEDCFFVPDHQTLGQSREEPWVPTNNIEPLLNEILGVAEKFNTILSAHRVISDFAAIIARLLEDASQHLSPNAYDLLMKKSLRHPGVVIRIAAAHQTSNANALEQCAKDKSDLVKVAVASSIRTPPYLLDALSRNENRGVKLAVAGNVNASHKTLKKLAEEELAFEAMAVHKNATLPGPFLEKFVRGMWERKRSDVFAVQDISGYTAVPETEDRWWNSQTDHLISVAYQDPATARSAERFNQLYKEAPLFTATRSNCPATILDRLAELDDVWVAEAVVGNPNTSPKTLLSTITSWLLSPPTDSLNDYGTSVEEWIILRHLPLPSEICKDLLAIANGSQVIEKYAAAAYPFEDESEWYTVYATHPITANSLVERVDCPPDFLHLVAVETFKKETEVSSSPETFMDFIVTSGRLVQIAGNPHVSEKTLKLIATHHDPTVVNAVIALADCSPDILWSIIVNPDQPLRVKEQAAVHPNCPVRARTVFSSLPK